LPGPEKKLSEDSEQKVSEHGPADFKFAGLLETEEYDDLP
jgi:hypothetical protein